MVYLPLLMNLHRVSASLACCTRTGSRRTERFFSHARDTHHALDRLRRRIFRLKQLLDSLACPKQHSFIAHGQTHVLPLRAKHCRERVDRAKSSEIEYAAGFFDGDGCVHGGARASNCELRVSQSIDGTAVLMFLLELFGGAIYLARPQIGACKPVLIWKIGGANARYVSQVMSNVSCAKQCQFRLAASWPTCQDERKVANAHLQRLKRLPPVTKNKCTWPYVAGFFDAEGHVRLSISCCVTLEIAQKFKEPLLEIQCLLQREWPQIDWKVRQNGSVFRLEATGTSQSRLVLGKLLDNGLIFKRASADLALRSTPSNHAQIRAELFKLSGNQSRYRWLNWEGCKRSRDIANLQKRVARSHGTRGQASLDVCSRLNELVMDHKQRTAAFHLSLLRSDIRVVLRLGARRVRMA